MEFAMRRWLRLSLVLIPLVCDVGLAFPQDQAAKPAWKVYSYPDDGFAMEAPSQPTLEKQRQATASGNIEMRQYSVDLTKESGVLMSVSDFPNANNASSKAILEGAVNGGIQAAKAKKTYEKDIERQQVPGIEFEGETGPYRLLGRYYWENGRLFALQAVAPMDTPMSADVHRVLDSLKFIAK